MSGIVRPGKKSAAPPTPRRGPRRLKTRGSRSFARPNPRPEPRPERPDSARNRAKTAPLRTNPQGFRPSKEISDETAPDALAPGRWPRTGVGRRRETGDVQRAAG